MAAGGDETWGEGKLGSLGQRSIDYEGLERMLRELRKALRMDGVGAKEALSK